MISVHYSSRILNYHKFDCTYAGVLEYEDFVVLSYPPDAVLQKRPAWALFVLLLSTLLCCQPTELILCFFV